MTVAPERTSTKAARPRFVEAEHPRDRKGRFIEKGGKVEFLFGGTGTVIDVVTADLIKVERDRDGKEVTVDRGYLTVVEKPDGSTPDEPEDPDNAAQVPKTPQAGFAYPVPKYKPTSGPNAGRDMKAGDRVTWHTRDGAEHTATIDHFEGDTAFVQEDGVEGLTPIRANGTLEHEAGGAAPAPDAQPAPDETPDTTPPVEKPDGTPAETTPPPDGTQPPEPEAETDLRTLPLADSAPQRQAWRDRAERVKDKGIAGSTTANMLGEMADAAPEDMLISPDGNFVAWRNERTGGLYLIHDAHLGSSTMPPGANLPTSPVEVDALFARLAASGVDWEAGARSGWKDPEQRNAARDATTAAFAEVPEPDAGPEDEAGPEPEPDAQPGDETAPAPEADLASLVQAFFTQEQAEQAGFTFDVTGPDSVAVGDTVVGYSRGKLRVGRVTKVGRSNVTFEYTTEGAIRDVEKRRDLYLALDPDESARKRADVAGRNWDFHNRMKDGGTRTGTYANGETYTSEITPEAQAQSQEFITANPDRQAWVDAQAEQSRQEATANREWARNATPADIAAMAHQTSKAVKFAEVGRRQQDRDTAPAPDDETTPPVEPEPGPEATLPEVGSRVTAQQAGMDRTVEGVFEGLDEQGFAKVRWTDDAVTPPREHVGRFPAASLRAVEAPEGDQPGGVPGIERASGTRTEKVKQTRATQRALREEMDAQGISETDPIRSITNDKYVDDQVVVARDAEGNIVGGVNFVESRGTDSLIIINMRVNRERQGIGQDLIRAVAEHTNELPRGDRYEMTVSGALTSARPFYVRTGADITNPNTPIPTWTPETTRRLASGGDMTPGTDAEMDRLRPYAARIDALTPAQRDRLNEALVARSNIDTTAEEYAAMDSMALARMVQDDEQHGNRINLAGIEAEGGTPEAGGRRFADVDALREHLRNPGDALLGISTPSRDPEQRRQYLADLAENRTLVLSENGGLAAYKGSEHGEGWQVITTGQARTLGPVGIVENRAQAVALANALEGIRDADGNPFPWDADDASKNISGWQSADGDSLPFAVARLRAGDPVLDPDGTYQRQVDDRDAFQAQVAAREARMAEQGYTETPQWLSEVPVGTEIAFEHRTWGRSETGRIDYDGYTFGPDVPRNEVLIVRGRVTGPGLGLDRSRNNTHWYRDGYRFPLEDVTWETLDGSRSGTVEPGRNPMIASGAERTVRMRPADVTPPVEPGPEPEPVPERRSMREVAALRDAESLNTEAALIAERIGDPSIRDTTEALNAAIDAEGNNVERVRQAWAAFDDAFQRQINSNEPLPEGADYVDFDNMQAVHDAMTTRLGQVGVEPTTATERDVLARVDDMSPEELADAGTRLEGGTQAYGRVVARLHDLGYDEHGTIRDGSQVGMTEPQQASPDLVGQRVAFRTNGGDWAVGTLRPNGNGTYRLSGPEEGVADDTFVDYIEGTDFVEVVQPGDPRIREYLNDDPHSMTTPELDAEIDRLGAETRRLWDNDQRVGDPAFDQVRAQYARYVEAREERPDTSPEDRTPGPGQEGLDFENATDDQVPPPPPVEPDGGFVPPIADHRVAAGLIAARFGAPGLERAFANYLSPFRATGRADALTAIRAHERGEEMERLLLTLAAGRGRRTWDENRSREALRRVQAGDTTLPMYSVGQQVQIDVRDDDAPSTLRVVDGKPQWDIPTKRIFGTVEDVHEHFGGVYVVIRNEQTGERDGQSFPADGRVEPWSPTGPEPDQDATDGDITPPPAPGPGPEPAPVVPDAQVAAGDLKVGDVAVIDGRALTITGMNRSAGRLVLDYTDENGSPGLIDMDPSELVGRLGTGPEGGKPDPDESPFPDPEPGVVNDDDGHVSVPNLVPGDRVFLGNNAAEIVETRADGDAYWVTTRNPITQRTETWPFGRDVILTRADRNLPDPTPLPEDVKTARPVLYTYQRKNLVSLGLDNHANPAVAEAARRVRMRQPLAQQHAEALADALREEASVRDVRPVRQRTLNRLAQSFDIAAVEAGSQRAVPEVPNRTVAERARLRDVGEGDGIAFAGRDGNAVFGRIISKTTKQSGRIHHLVIERPDGTRENHVLSGNTATFLMPDLPDPTPLPPEPEAGDDGPRPEHIDVRDVRVGDRVIVSPLPANPDVPRAPDPIEVTVSEVTHANGRSEFITSDGQRHNLFQSKYPSVVRVARGALSANQPYGATLPAENPTKIGVGDIRVGDRIRIGKTWRDLDGFVHGVETVEVNDGDGGTAVGKMLSIRTLDGHITGQVVADGDDITRLSEGAPDAEEAIRREEQVREREQRIGYATDKVEAASRRAAQTFETTLGGPTYLAIRDDIANGRYNSGEALRFALNQLASARVNDPSRNATSVSGGDIARAVAGLGAGPDRAAFEERGQEIAEQLRQRAYDRIEESLRNAVPLDGETELDAVVRAAGATDMPPGEARRIAESLVAIREAVENADAGGTADQIPEGFRAPERTTLSQRAQAYREAIGTFGKTRQRVTTFESVSIEDLERGVTPAIVTEDIFTREPKAKDGGPGEVTMRHLDAVRAFGKDLDGAMQRRMTAMLDGDDTPLATVAEMEERKKALYKELHERENLRREEIANAQRAYAVEQGFENLGEMQRQYDTARWFTSSYLARVARGAETDAAMNERFEREHAVTERLNPLLDEAARIRERVTEQSNAEVQRLREEARAARDAAEAYGKRVNEAKRQAALAVLEEAGVEFGGPRTTWIDDKRGSGKELTPRSKPRRMMEWAEDHYPRSWREQVTKRFPRVQLGVTSRGYNMGGVKIKLSKGVSHLPSGDPFEHVAVHELGHSMEAAIPGLSEAEFALLFARSSAGPVGERVRTGGRGSVDGRTTWKDDFPESYTGKEYGNEINWEVFTTAVESLFAGSPYADDDLRQWTLGVLALLG